MAVLARGGGSAADAGVPRSALLLFANAFSAYATAAALVSQGSPIVPLLIRSALTSEVVLGQARSRQGDGAGHGRGGRW